MPERANARRARSWRWPACSCRRVGGAATMPRCFGTISAVGHVAPAARAIPGGIEVGARAVRGGAPAHASQIARNE